MIDPVEVVRLFESRRRSQGAFVAHAREVQRVYDNEIVVPLPELDQEERPGVANLLAQGVDQLAMRLSGVDPDVVFQPDGPGPEAEETARTRRRAVLAWIDQNDMTVREARRDRFLVAYGSGPTIVGPTATNPGEKRKIPHWRVVNPLAYFPSATVDPDDIEPSNVIVQRYVTLGWLRRNYPAQASRLYKGAADSRQGVHPDDQKFDLLEYNDDMETVLVVAGAPKSRWTYSDISDGISGAELLERYPNLAGICLSVNPSRITLGKLSGHFDQIIGMFMSQAKMNAYEQIAVFRSIFPELWVVSHPNSPTQARIIQKADGREGVVGEIENGSIVAINPQVGQMASQAVDRLERSQRVATSIPSDWGGESATNIRTAKRGEQVSASAVDPNLGELQNILARGRKAEIERAIAVQKAWYGSFQVSFYQSRTGRNQGDEKYRPRELFTSDALFVKYSMPGVDAAGIPIELGQRTQTGEMSMDTARRSDPMIEDPDHERDQVEVEGLRMALLKGLEAQVQQGTLDPQEIALIVKMKQTDRNVALEEAVEKAHEIIQQQQAAQQQAPPGGPETQPGLGQGPGVPGAQQGPPPLAQLLGSLRGPTQQSPAEQALSGAPQGG